VRRIQNWREALTVGAFLAPALVLVGLFTVAPGVWAVVQSFTDRALVGRDAANVQFIGLDNYARLAADPDFAASLGRTVVFVLLSAIVGQTVLGFLTAYLLASRPRWRLRFSPAFAAIFLLPLAVPEAVAALAWASIANGTEQGFLNRMVGAFGAEPVQWLQEHAMATIIVVNIWRGIPFAMVLFSAALEGIPREVLEMSLVDGATAWQQFRRIILGILRPQILLFLMLTTITTFGIFGLVYFLTRGGPGDATTLIGIYIYLQGFKFFEIGFGSAAATVMLVILLTLGVYYVRLMREQA
jgi:multiple sugar transport system permease protein